MGNKRFFLIIIFLMLCLPMVFSQAASQYVVVADEDDTDDTAEANYYIERSGRELRFIQRLIWEAGNYVLRYEVIIEQLGRTGYAEVERVSVNTNYADVSLPVGRFRYKVEVYDLFDELAFVTPYWEFEIIRAIQPGLSSFNPRAFYLDEDEVWEIQIRGSNFSPQSVFYLVNKDNRRINPVSVEIDGNSALLVFSGSSLATGEYDVYVRNPGGLDARDGTFTITNKKLTDWNFYIGYAPIIPLYGYLFQDTLYHDEYLEAPFSGDFYPLSIAAKINFIPIKRVWGNLGVEASSSFAIFEQTRGDYITSTYLLTVHASLLYQRYFRKRTLSFNAGIGAGITSLLDLKYEYQKGMPTESINATYLSATGGLSFTVFVTRQVFINAGADFIHVFTILTSEKDSPMPGFIRPFIGAGYQY